MTVPSVRVTKNPFALGSVPPSPDGIAAYLANSASGVAGQVGTFSNANSLLSAVGYGPLAEYGAYNIANAGLPVVAVQPPTVSVPATYGSITSVILGSSVPTAGTTHPLEHYNIQVNITNGGTVGVAGIMFTYSPDGGNTVVGPLALGTATTLTIPNSGVSFALAAGTLDVGDHWSCFTERALMNDSDITAATTILNNSNLAWEIAFLDAVVGSATIGLCDSILAGWEALGKFKIFALNTRFKNEPEPTAESEAAYLAAMTTLVGAQTSERVMVGADGGHVPSTLTGYNLKRPTSLGAVARAMALTPNIGTAPSYIATGPIAGYQIADANGNPFDHDEYLFPGLDDLGLTTFRSFAPGGPQGVYLTHANIISPNNSDIKRLQQLRVLNKACSITWQVLVTQLNLGVRTQVNPQTGALNIAEIDAMKIENLVNPQLQSSLKGQVTSVQFFLNRDDNLQANPVKVGGTVEVVGLVYIDEFDVTVAFAKTLAATGS